MTVDASSEQDAPSRTARASEDAWGRRLARLLSQVAVVRTIADEVEHLTRPRDADGVRAQLVEEMARLGCRILEAAAALTERLLGGATFEPTEE